MRIEAVPQSPIWADGDPTPFGPTQARMARDGHTVGPLTTVQAWRGERVDIGWAIDVLRARDTGLLQSTG